MVPYPLFFDPAGSIHFFEVVRHQTLRNRHVTGNIMRPHRVVSKKIQNSEAIRTTDAAHHASVWCNFVQ